MQKDRAILFIGFKQKSETIIAAREMGFKTILFTNKFKGSSKAFFDKIFQFESLDEFVTDEIIQEIQNRYDVKAVISNYEHFVVPRSYLAEKLGVSCTSTVNACFTRNKALQRQKLSGLPENVDFRIVTNHDEAEKAFHELNGDVFLKSIAGVKSAFVFHIREKDQLQNALHKIFESKDKLDLDLYENYSSFDLDCKYPDPRENFLVEKAVNGKQVTLSSLISNEQVEHMPSLCDIYTAHDIGLDDSFLAFRILPSKYDDGVINKVHVALEKVYKLLGLRNCSTFVDLIITEEEEIKIIELASRMGGYRPQMYKAAYGIDIARELVKAAMGEQINLQSEFKQYVSMVEIFSQKEGIIKEIQNMDILYNDINAHKIRILFKTGDKVGKAKDGLKNLVNFYLTGDSYEEVYERSLYYQKILVPVLE